MIKYVFILDSSKNSFIIGKPKRFSKKYKQLTTKITESLKKETSKNAPFKKYTKFSNHKTCFSQISKKRTINVITERINKNKKNQKYVYEFISILDSEMQKHKRINRFNSKFRKFLKTQISDYNKKMRWSEMKNSGNQKFLKNVENIDELIQGWDLVIDEGFEVLEIKEDFEENKKSWNPFLKGERDYVNDPMGIKEKVRVGFLVFFGFLTVLFVFWILHFVL